MELNHHYTIVPTELSKETGQGASFVDGASDNKRHFGESTKQPNMSVKENLKEFSDRTTFHGLRYISEDGSVIRRLMWIVTVVACVCAVGYQIVDRVMFYYDWPVSVNVKINYNQSLAFPAVTICNQNAFKATAAANLGYYHLIEDMFSKSTKETLESIHRHGAENVTIEDLYVSLSHNKDDFIVKCRWSGVDCSPEQFQSILTDHGICYKFKENSTRMTVSSSGVEAGLQLTLNVEQYEYMTGPHDSAGVKMLLHDPRETPFVHALGQAIPTGSHAFVGVKFMMIKNLEYPYGNCENVKLEHTGYYTTEECYIACLTKTAKDVCGCRDMYMPNAYGNPDVCSLEQYFSCLKDFEDTFNEKYAPECKCQVPCRFSLFEPTLSYATISNHVVQKILSSNESITLKENLLQASETTARLDTAKRDEFESLVYSVRDRVEDLKAIFGRVSDYVLNQTSENDRILNETNSAYAEKERLYRFQEYSVEKNFLRGREAMEERVLANIALGFAEFARLNRRKIRHLVTIPLNESSSREDLYRSVIDSLTVRQELSDLAKNNISVLYGAFVNGTKIFNYMFEDIPRSHNPYIVPKPLLNDSMFYNSYVRKHGPRLFETLDIMHNVLDMFMDEATTAFLNATINETQLNYVFERYQFACRTYMFSKSVMYSQGIDRPVPILRERRNEFDQIWDDFSKQSNEMTQNFNSIVKSLHHIENNLIKKLNFVVDSLSNYFNTENGSLMALAGDILSTDTKAMLSTLRDFFQELDTRGHAIFDSWTIMVKHITDLWTKILDDEDMIEYYEFTNNSRFLQNLTEVLDSYTCACTRARDKLDVRKTVIKNEDEEFFRAMDAITEHLTEFKSSIKIDSSFLRENFLQLDIFFKQLSYEDIKQQKAYDFFALICDIGGSMGLFIGASMLTIMEVIDLVLSQTPVFATQSGKKRNSGEIRT